MRKRTSKLVLRKETVRELSGQELSRAIGGQETDADGVPFSRDKQCQTSGRVAAALDAQRAGG